MPKTTIDTELRARIDAFVDELRVLVHQSALEAVRDALEGGSATPARLPPGRPRKKAKATRRKTGKRVRRSSEDVDSTATAILAHVKATPGQSVSEIGAALGLSTKDMRLPVLKLIGEKKLKTTGQRRGTKYFAGGRGSAKKKAARKKAGKKAKRKTVKRTTAKRGRRKKKATRRAAA